MKSLRTSGIFTLLVALAIATYARSAAVPVSLIHLYNDKSLTLLTEVIITPKQSEPSVETKEVSEEQEALLILINHDVELALEDADLPPGASTAIISLNFCIIIQCSKCSMPKQEAGGLISAITT